MASARATSAFSNSGLGDKFVLAHVEEDGGTVDRMVVLGDAREASVETFLTTIEGRAAVEAILARRGDTLVSDALGGVQRVDAPMRITSGIPAQDQAVSQTEFLITALGSGAELARLLGVNRSQPSNWRSGKERPGPTARRNLLDLYYVMAKALQVFPAKAATDWLHGNNAYLDGARPIDVLRLHGSRDVVQALEVALA